MDPRPGLVDGRALLVALVVASPAAYGMSQGLVTMGDVLTRYLVIAGGCAALAALVRGLWPILAGEPQGARPAPAALDRAETTPGLTGGDEDRADELTTEPVALDRG